MTGGETITIVAGVKEHMAGQSNKACLSNKMREREKQKEVKKIILCFSFQAVFAFVLDTHGYFRFLRCW